MKSSVSAGRALGWSKRRLVLLLVGLVLVGDVCPSIYGALQPHRHLFLGGPPPSHWQDHAHPSPLYALLGPPGGGLGKADLADEATSPPLGLVQGRVVSLYAGDLGVLSQFLDAVVLAPAVPIVAPPGLSGRTAARSARLVLQHSDGPTPPPPRAD